jgi:predicted Rossmann fold nucleotide-binding protein DprA/Smf involved in DNA uptake
MKILIAGSRSIKDFDLSPHIPPGTDLIIAGGASGIDMLAEQYADHNRISKLILRPHYQLYGKAAPIKRNEIMVDLADYVLVIWDGKSRGSQHTIQYAKKKEKALVIVKA